jgi:hypothetical protein
MSGVLNGCMGLLFIPFALIGGLASTATQQTNGAIGGAVIIVFGIIAPVRYGGIGFVFGAIGAWIYNQIAKRLGGSRFSWNLLLHLFVEGLAYAASRVCLCPPKPEGLASAVLKSKVWLVISYS